MIKVIKLHANICKHQSCLNRAMYEFTDIKNMAPEGSLEASEYQKTITLGYSCEKHVDEVDNLLKEMYDGD